MLSLTWSCERIGSILLPHGVFAGTDVFFLSAAAAAHDVHVHATFCPFATFAMAEAEAKARAEAEARAQAEAEKAKAQAEAEKAQARAKGRLQRLWGVPPALLLLASLRRMSALGASCCHLHSACSLARTCSS